jgi:hypothetical protein
MNGCTFATSSSMSRMIWLFRTKLLLLTWVFMSENASRPACSASFAIGLLDFSARPWTLSPEPELDSYRVREESTGAHLIYPMLGQSLSSGTKMNW